MAEESKKDTIDLGKIAQTLWAKRKKFLYVWVIVFILSCIWILPQPRYYNCSVSLAPETTSDISGVSSLASSFGINLDGANNDAIYPMLYPDLMQSPEFLVGLFQIRIRTEDSTVNTDYYTYIKKHQKKNWLTSPFRKLKTSIAKIFQKPNNRNGASGNGINPFFLSKEDFEIMNIIGSKIVCAVDQKTDVITISATDQDRLVCALLADSVRQHLQDFIIKYRTSKARLDVEHYQHLADSAKSDYEKAVALYSDYCDANKDIILQNSISERDKLENNMQMKYNTYNAMTTQLEAIKARLQEKTPAFTILKTATVPLLPAGPKRMLFVLFMLVLSTLVESCVILKHDIHKLMIFHKE